MLEFVTTYGPVLFVGIGLLAVLLLSSLASSLARLNEHIASNTEAIRKLHDTQLLQARELERLGERLEVIAGRASEMLSYLSERFPPRDDSP
jgi:hypothetical protein